MKNFYLILLLLFLVACKTDHKNESKNISGIEDSTIAKVVEGLNTNKIIKHAYQTINDSCELNIEQLDLNTYFDNIKFPIKKSSIIADTLIKKRSQDFLIFEKCDYLIFNQLKEIQKGLELSGYISDYGYINGNRVILIWIEYPCQNRATLVTFRKNKLIDELEIANHSCQDPPCDILYNNDSLLVDSYNNKATFLSTDTFETSWEWSFIKKNNITDEKINEIGQYEKKLYFIDPSGKIKFLKKTSDKKEYFDSTLYCF